MALAPPAPWSQPLDTMGIIRSAAQIGLESRGQDIGQQEAADRLSLAYNQLASQERRASEAAKSKLELAHSTLQMKANQMDMLHEYRMNVLKQKQDELGLRESRGEALDKYRTERQGDQEKILDLRKQAIENAASSAADRLDLQQQALDLRKEKAAKDPERESFIAEGTPQMFEAIRRQNPGIPEPQALTLAKDMLRANYDETAARQKRGAGDLLTRRKSTTVSVPPPSQREVGKVYPLPKGNFRWTERGWVAVQSKPAPEPAPSESDTSDERE